MILAFIQKLIFVCLLLSIEANCKYTITVTNGRSAVRALNKRDHPTTLVLLVKYENVSFHVDLHVNTMLFAATYVEKVVTKNGSVEVKNDMSKNSCYYVGSVRNEEESSAAFSTCDVLRGFIRVRNDTFHITTTPNNTFKITKESNNKIALWYDGISSLKRSVLDSSSSRRKKRSIQKGGLEDRLVIELYIVNDKAIYLANDKDHNKVFGNTKEIANNANLLYETTKIHVILVGAEVWVDEDKIQVSAVSGETLDNFYVYRFNNIPTYNDNAYLISGISFNESVLGLARLGTMCSTIYSGGILMGIKNRNDVSGAILAHEIGHNLGMLHDDQSCECESTTVGCIMNRHASTVNSGVFFSSCSKQKLSDLRSTGFDICLHNIPRPLDQYLSVCNNGILENGEDCDCGRLPSDICNKACCVDCKLTTKASCAQGKCCDVDTCSLKAQNTVCRQASSQCDIEERCDGQNFLCPFDVTAQKGIPCNENNKEGYCFDGICQNKDNQCKTLYGPNAKESHINCYEFNKVGSAHGFCSRSFQFNRSLTMEFTGCTESKKLCGVLQCDALPSQLVKNYNYKAISQKSYNNNNCMNIIFDVGDDVQDPSYVPNGSPCGQDKMCYNKNCLSAYSIQSTFRCERCINGQCGSDGKCHCNVNYEGASCEDLSEVTPRTPAGKTTTATWMTPGSYPSSSATKIPIQLPDITSSGGFNSATRMPTQPPNITSFDGFNNSRKYEPKYIALIIIPLILLIVAFIIYDSTHKRHIKSFFENKKDKVVAANVKMRENGKRDDIKRLSNHGFEEDHSYVTMPGENQLVYANQQEVGRTGTYSYEQPSPALEIINANLTTPQSSFPPSLVEAFKDQGPPKLILASRDSMWPIESFKPPVPDASLKPTIQTEYEFINSSIQPFEKINQYGFESEASYSSGSVQTPKYFSAGSTNISRPNKLELRRDFPSPTGSKSPIFNMNAQLQLHLTELNNNPTFGKIKERLKSKDSVA